MDDKIEIVNSPELKKKEKPLAEWWCGFADSYQPSEASE